MNADESRSIVVGLVHQIAPEVDVESIDPNVDLRREVDLDSLDFMTLVELIARDTHVEIRERDYPQVRTLNSLAAYITAHTQ